MAFGGLRLCLRYFAWPQASRPNFSRSVTIMTHFCDSPLIHFCHKALEVKIYQSVQVCDKAFYDSFATTERCHPSFSLQDPNKQLKRLASNRTATWQRLYQSVISLILHFVGFQLHNLIDPYDIFYRISFVQKCI